MLDSGLLGALLKVPSRVIILGDKLFSEYQGAFIENFVSQELSAHIDLDDIFYWTSKSEAEVDFIVLIGREIFPLEVKGGFSRRTKSLRVYAEKYHPAGIFRTSPRNFTCDGDFTNIPLYAISLFPTLSPAIV
jgi:predicted AAA+ superfamily ATPase